MINIFFYLARKDVYNSKWFAFEAFAFLHDRDEPRPTINTENVSSSTDSNNTIYIFILYN